jgi:radical SAM protein with 4Fe4S-binding SPASM domain
MSNLRYLKEKSPSIRIRLTTTLTTENKGQMWKLGKICQYVDAESITVIPLRPQVRDPGMVRHMVTAQEFKKVIQDLIQAQQELGVKFTTTLETDYAGKIYRDPVFRKRSSCAAGREGANLDYDADRKKFLVYGCAYSPACDLDARPEIREPFIAGEFSVDDPGRFLDIWRDESAWTIFRDLSLKSDDCRDCKYYADHTCTGSCQIQNLDFSRIRADADVLAQLRDQIARTGEWYCYQKVLG